MAMMKYLPPLLLFAVQAATAAEINPEANVLALGFYNTPEIDQPIALKVSGNIPSWLSGSLYRGGAGSWDIGNYTAEHWFDGLSRTHRFDIANGAVEYRSKNESDELRDFILETGKWPGGSFGEDPCKIILGAFQTTFRDGIHPKGNASSANVDVTYFPNFPGLARNTSSVGGTFTTLVGTTDGATLQQIDPVSLDPIEIFSYQAANQELATGGDSASHAAHGVNGELYNYVLNATSIPPVYRVFEINSTGTGRILATIEDAPPAYIHSTFSTDNYVILIVWQADFGPTPKPTYNILDSLKPWNPDRDVLFYVIDKVNGGVIAKYTADTFFAFHEVNSFEDPDTNEIVIDIPTMPDYSFLELSRMENLRTMLGAQNASINQDMASIFSRYRLPGYKNATLLSNGTIVSQAAVLDFQLDRKYANLELPRINQAYAGKPYQFAYGTHTVKKGYFSDSIIKIEVLTQSTKIWSPKGNYLPCEPIFVASPNATCEDDGVILTVALEAERKLSTLIILDAKEMREIGRADMPIVFPNGFHGAWGSN